MSISGTYKMIDGKLTKISDRIPSLNGVFSVHCDEPYYSQSLGQVVMSKAHKRYLMDKHNLIERGPNDVHAKAKPKPAPHIRQKQIEEGINRYLTDRCVEGIKLKDLPEASRRRNESCRVNQTKAEIREAVGQVPELA